MTLGHPGLLVVGSILLQAFSTESSTAILTVLTDKNNSSAETTRLFFDDNMFFYFHNCLCGDYTTKCAAYYEKVHLENSVNVSAIVTDSASTVLRFSSNYFRCQNDASGKHVTCTRLKRYQLKCHRTDELHTAIPNPPLSACGMACVGIRWYSAQKESLTYNSIELKNGVCQRSCYGQVKATPKNPVPREPTKASTPKQMTTSVPKISTMERKRRKKKSLEHFVPLFIFLAIFLFIAILLVIFIVVIRERKKRSYEVGKKSKSSTHVNSLSDSSHDNPGMNDPAPAVQSSTGNSAKGTVDEEVAL